MTKQEEIREGLKRYLRPNLKYEDEGLIDGVTDMALLNLHSQGVVIKVDRELPKKMVVMCPGTPARHVEWFTHSGEIREAQQKMLEAGYVATEPLIKE